MNPSLVLPNIVHCCLTEGNAPRLAVDTRFMNATIRSHQIARRFELASDMPQIGLPINSVRRAFEIDHSVVKRAQVLGYEDRPAGRRHRQLAPQSDQALLSFQK
jgi:hypothetical protein